MRETLDSKSSAQQAREGRRLPDPQIGPDSWHHLCGGGAPEPVQVDERTLGKLHGTGALMQTLVMLELSGKKTGSCPARCSSIRSPTPCSHRFPSADAGGRVTLDIPVRFRGQENSPA